MKRKAAKVSLVHIDSKRACDFTLSLLIFDIRPDQVVGSSYDSMLKLVAGLAKSK